MTSTAFYAYLWTISRDVNGIVDESAPSPVSNYVETTGKRTITRPASGLFQPRVPSAIHYGYGLTRGAAPLANIVGCMKDTISGNDILTLDANHDLVDNQEIGIAIPVSPGKFKAAAIVKVTTFPAIQAMGKVTQTVNSPTTARPGRAYDGSQRYVVAPVRGYIPGLGSSSYKTKTPIMGKGFLLPFIPTTSRAKMFVHLSWAAVPGAHAYAVFLGTAATGYQLLAYTSSSVTEYYDDGTGTTNPAVVYTGQDLTANRIVSIPRGIVGAANSYKDVSGQFTDLTSEASLGWIVGTVACTVKLPTTYDELNVGDPVVLSGTNEQADNVPYPPSTTVASLVDPTSFTIKAFCVKDVAVMASTDAYLKDRVIQFGEHVDNTNLTWNVYRAGNGTGFQLAASRLPWSQTEWEDDVDTTALGVTLPTFYTDSAGIDTLYAPAPASLRFPCMHAGRMYGIAGDRTVRWTPAGVYDAWPAVFSTPFQDAIPMALVSSSAGLVVLCDTAIWVGHPVSDSVMQWQKVVGGTGCIAPATAKATPLGVVFLSDAGLKAFIPETGKVVDLLGDRFNKRFFQAAQVEAENYPHWLPPTGKTFAFTYLTRDVPGEHETAILAGLSAAPQATPLANMKAIYGNKRYYLFNATPPVSGKVQDTWGVLCIDMAMDEPVVTQLNIRPMAGHASNDGNVYWLLPSHTGTRTVDENIAVAIKQEILGANDPATSTPGADGRVFSDVQKPDAPLVFSHDPVGGLGQTTLMRLRTGPIEGNGTNPVVWEGVEFHGKGNVWAAFIIDGFRIPETGWARAEATETPNESRRIQFPANLRGYALDIDMICDGELMAIEIEGDPA